MTIPIKWPVLAGLFVLAVLLFYLFYPKVENFFVFFPHRAHDFTPETFNLTYQDVYFKASDGVRLHGWFFPLQKKAPVILFFHGNAGNISHRLDNVRHLVQHGFQVFIFDYRGYGKSSGRPSEKGIYKDGLAGYDHLTKELGIGSDHIILFGRSLGAAVAIETAGKRAARSIIIESAFTSTKHMARAMILFLVLSPFLPPHYNNLAKIPRLEIPKLIIHGDADEIVPFAMGKELFRVSREPKFFYPIRGAGHNDTYVVGGERYFRTISKFIQDSNDMDVQ
jgi:fermentation-respiration switch protein FrsA (DUF1100 family)